MVMPDALGAMVERAHPSWRAVLADGLRAMSAAQPEYLPDLLAGDFLPDGGRLFAAFLQPLDSVRHVLVGEGPYPRAASATGVCFMDGAVGSLWSAGGLSKAVNRATSLRNFVKMLLVADGRLSPAHTAGDALAQVAGEALAGDGSTVGTLAQLQRNLLANGFLLLNAALAFRPEVPPVREARAWQPFFLTVLSALADHAIACERAAPDLVLWGKVAAQVNALSIAQVFPKVLAEHPYNLSFITNSHMHAFFAPMHLLRTPVA